MIDLLNLTENKVSTDFSGYPVVFIGETGDGKTYSLKQYLESVAPEGKKPLFIEFEDRYKSIAGILAQRVYSIPDVLSVLGQLKNPKVREKFSGVVFDTIDKFEEMASSYQAQNKEVEIIEEIGFGKGKKYLKSTLGIITEIRNLGLPVHFTAQSYETEDIMTKKKTVMTKVAQATKDKIFHDAFLVGKVSIDPKSKDPLHSDRLITFRKDSVNIELKDTFGLPLSMKVGDIKNNLEKYFDSNFDESQKTSTQVLEEIIDTDDFELIKVRGNALGGILAENGRLEEAFNILRTNIGIADEKTNQPKMFDDLLPTQKELAKVVVMKLEEVCKSHNIAID